jgi:hypothetical protein
MWRRLSFTSSPFVILIAALLLPGGFLVLCVALYRRFSNSKRVKIC